MDSKTRSYITTLTPLRGIAALLVVVYHSNLIVNPFLNKYTSLLSRGYLWVDFFFILSGFILSYVYGHKFQKSIKRPEYWKYLGSRFARIYPLHLFTLTWALICALIIRQLAHGLHPWFDELFNPHAFPASLLLIHALNIYNVPPLNSPSWSLSTEWWVYVIFPFFVPFFSRIKTAHQVFILFIIVISYFSLMYLLGPHSGVIKGLPKLDITEDYGILRCILGFLLGMLIHDLYKKQIWYSSFSKDWFFLLFASFILTAMHFALNDLLIVALFPFIILSATYNRGEIKRLLDIKILQQLGDWSFSIYMVHIPLIYLYNIYQVSNNPRIFSDFYHTLRMNQNGLTGFLSCIVLVIATLIIASLTYRFVELPSRKVLNRLFEKERRKEKSIVTETVEV